jgi:hypothetical protein
MTVNEALEALQKLADEGHGFLELICEDVRSGDTGSVHIYAETSDKNDGHTMGKLCEWQNGRKFVPVYVDH